MFDCTFLLPAFRSSKESWGQYLNCWGRRVWLDLPKEDWFCLRPRRQQTLHQVQHLGFWWTGEAGKGGEGEKDEQGGWERLGSCEVMKISVEFWSQVSGENPEMLFRWKSRFFRHCRTKFLYAPSHSVLLPFLLTILTFLHCLLYSVSITLHTSVSCLIARCTSPCGRWRMVSKVSTRSNHGSLIFRLVLSTWQWSIL